MLELRAVCIKLGALYIPAVTYSSILATITITIIIIIIIIITITTIAPTTLFSKI
jgi:5-bromo-4-chloroindolyl phosphate hydrolysis protein